jgi:hypothetical protein
MEIKGAAVAANTVGFERARAAAEVRTERKTAEDSAIERKEADRAERTNRDRQEAEARAAESREETRSRDDRRVDIRA